MDIVSATEKIVQTLWKIYTSCQEYREADSTIKAMKLRLNSVGIRLELFQKYLLKRNALLNARRKAVLRTSLEHLADLLESLRRKVPESSSLTSKAAWVGWGKQAAEKILSQLQDWEADVQGTIFALDLLSKARNDDVLFKRLFDTGERALTPAWALSKRIHAPSVEPTRISFSKLSLRGGDGEKMLATIGRRTVYLEVYRIDGLSEDEKERQKKSIHRIASVFHSELLPSMHLLSCDGMAEEPTPGPWHHAYLVYELPAALDLHPASHLPTLAYALEKCVRMALEDRYRLAAEITTAVMEIHAANWVHKSIRSDTVLVKVVESGQADGKGVARVGSAFLVGFTAARPQISVMDTPYALAQYYAQPNPCNPETNIYKWRYLHPERRGTDRGDIKMFDLRHDMYSLGAVLIEIGYRRTLKDMFSGRSSAIPSLHESQITHTYLTTYARRLTDKMGWKYAHAALTCLTKSTETGKQLDVLREEFYDEVLRPLRDIVEGFGVGRIVHP